MPLFKSYIIDGNILLSFFKPYRESAGEVEEIEIKAECKPIGPAYKAPYEKVIIDIKRNPAWPPITTVEETNEIPMNRVNNLNNTKQPKKDI